jgi:capsular polysaccharide biosynthesis protein
LELRAYWTIIWRRFWLVVLVVGVVGLYVGYQYYHLRKTPGALTAYRSDITIQIGLVASPNGTDSSADNVAVSESLADAMVMGPILTSKEFDMQISRQVGVDTNQNSSGADLGDWTNAGTIGSALTAVRTDNLVTVSVTWSTSDGAKAVATAFGEVSRDSICSYLEYVVSKEASCSAGANSTQPAVSAQVISNASDPVPAPGLSASKQTLLFILLAVALLVGIAMAFLVDYLDDRIHSRDDAVHLLQLPVYGEVPRAPAVGRTKAKSSTA